MLTTVHILLIVIVIISLGSCVLLSDWLNLFGIAKKIGKKAKIFLNIGFILVGIVSALLLNITQS